MCVCVCVCVCDSTAAGNDMLRWVGPTCAGPGSVEEASIASSSLEEHSLFSPEMKVSMETLVHSTPHNKQTAMWGHRVHMGGQLGPVCLFSEALSPAAVRLLHAKGAARAVGVGAIYNVSCLVFLCVPAGPNNLALFQPKFPETHELAPKLFLYYHPKVVCLYVYSMCRCM